MGGDQKVFLATPFFIPNPRRLTSATPIRGISRLRCGPFGTLGPASLSVSVKTRQFSGYSAKSDLEAPQTGHFQLFGMSLNGVPGAIPPSGSPSAGS